MIAAYEAEIAALEAIITRLVALKSTLQGTIIPEYTSPISETEIANENLKKSFTIDGEAIDKKTIETRKVTLEEISNTLSNKVIPAIDAKISELNARIAHLRYLIAQELERIRREAEAAAAAAAVSKSK